MHRGVRQQLGPGGCAEALADEEVAVAVHEVQRHAAPRQAAQQPHHDGVERHLQIVVADPVLEKIAEDVERLGSGRRAFEKIDEPLVRCRPVFGEMKIGDEQRGHCCRACYFFAPTTVTDSITIGCFGTTLLNGPAGSVWVLAILVTTSMPDTTLPNTA